MLADTTLSETQVQTTDHPILYSFRRCPYAMRARMALWVSGVTVELREVVLRDKPSELLEASPKATVPVLIPPNGEILSESLDIMRWALARDDPPSWLSGDDALLIDTNDGPFKAALDRYKYPHRYDLPDGLAQRDEGLNILSILDQRLADKAYLTDVQCRFTDIALFPFVRQFAETDRRWFDALPLPHLQAWLAHLVGGELFASIMARFPQWKTGDNPVFFGRNALAEISLPA